MSKLFFDHLIVLSEVEVFIKNSSKSSEEKDELWSLVDEIIHHRVLDIILGSLPKDKHIEFLEMFNERPHDENLLDYLKEKISNNFDEIIKQEIGVLGSEIIKEIKSNG